MKVKSKIISYFSYKQVLNDTYNSQDCHCMENDEIIELQRAMLEILKDLMEVCEKYHIRPFLQGGTLLGKIRHNGFIPWDDDLDIGMSRVDYEKFKKIFDAELSSKYILMGPGVKTGATNRFLQMFKINSYFETIDGANDTPKKIYIDIFPIDYASNNNIRRKIKGIHSNILMIIASCVECNTHYNSTTKKMMQNNIRFRINMTLRIMIGKLFSYHSLNKWYEKVDMCIRRNRESGYATSATGRKHYLGEIVHSDVFFPLQRVDYCGVGTWMPNKPEIYLENLYGEGYMEIPEESKREHHFIVKMIANTASDS